MNNSLYIGLLSGSSMDAIDAALVSFADPNSPKLILTEAYPIPSQFKERCLKMSQQAEGTIDEFGSLDAWAGELFAEAVLSLIKNASLSPDQICAIGSHGQNLRHCPSANPPFSLQIGDPNIIAERTGILTIADFRRRDLAAGGQGAPLAPGFHAVVFGSEQCDRIIVNIGGISNLTLLPKDKLQPILGFDTGPGNCLMDSWAEKYWGFPFDKDGTIASQGQISSRLLTECLNDDYFKKSPPKSTGREYFNLEWFERKMQDLLKSDHSHNEFSPKDIQATLLALTVESLSQMIACYAKDETEIFICGGGAHNIFLLKSLSEKLKKPVHSTELLGIAPDWVEAMLFAWLAKQTLAGKSGNCPSVTGAKHAISLGGIFGHSQDNKLVVNT